MFKLKILLILILTLLAVGCSTSTEQGTVQVETTYGKVVKIHRSGDWFTTFGVGTTSFEVDMRNHLDGVDYEGVTKDNAPFGMKVDVVYHPIDKDDEIIAYVTALGFDPSERATRRWGVLNQLVKNSCRDATSGKYDAYDLRANQAAILSDIKKELDTTLGKEMHIEVASVGMEIQPQFKDGRIDDAANQVVAAQKLKQAAEAQKAAAQTNLEKAQIDNKIYTDSPQAYQLAVLEKQRQIAEAWSHHQGTLILGPAQGVQIHDGGK
jgi:hypothetical protein